MVITPTRIILVAPELLMGNRVLRQWDPKGDLMLRVQFRDEDGSTLFRHRVTDRIVDSTIAHWMNNGMIIAGLYFFMISRLHCLI